MTHRISTQCPECDSDISVSVRNRDEQLNCPDCETPLEIARMEPLALAHRSDYFLNNQ